MHRATELVNQKHAGIRRKANPKALELFSHLEKDLALIRPDLPSNVVLCPLCLKSFRREHLEGPDPLLTIEHVIPKTLGGIRETLTCKHCNNTQGSELEGHLVRRIRAHNALAGTLQETTLNGKIECEGRTLGVRLQIVHGEDGGRETAIKIQGGPPELLRRWSTRLRCGNLDEITFRLSLDYIEERSRLALVRVAYLIMFAEYGYRYILGEGPQMLRKLIQGKIRAADQETWRFADQLDHWECDQEHGNVDCFVVSVPEHGYVVIFKISLGVRRFFSVLMPAHDEPSANVFSQLHKLSELVTGKQMCLQRAA